MAISPNNSHHPPPLCGIFLILVSPFFSILCFCTFENVKKCVLGGCTITSKTKINVFWNFFFTPLAPSGPLHSKKFQKMLILAFEANSALSRENETKIVKITHSAWSQQEKNYICQIWNFSCTRLGMNLKIPNFEHVEYHQKPNSLWTSYCSFQD